MKPSAVLPGGSRRFQALLGVPCLCLLSSSPAHARPAAAVEGPFDLILRGGRVIDPRAGLDARLDIGIRAHRIAAVAAALPRGQATKEIDVSGLTVVPGFVDLHAHVFGGTPGRVNPDSHTLRSCVTTVVDAGSVGWRDFPTAKAEVIDKSDTRVLAFLNIVGAGMHGRAGEQRPADMDPARAAETVRAHRERIVGIKTAHYDGPEWIAVDRALEAGKLAGVPVMVDFGTFRPERPFVELVGKRMRPGDIYTHLFLGPVPMLDGDGRLRPYLGEAQRRGVLFDVGHGQGSFLFRQAVPALRQGFRPDTISTDLHTGSMNAGMKDMVNVLSKFLNMGMRLDEVIGRATWAAAKAIRREELGHLGVGAPADLAVVKLEEGRFGFVDSYKAGLRGDRRIACELTIRDGLVVWEQNAIARRSWDQLGAYLSQGDPRWDGTHEDPPSPGASTAASKPATVKAVQGRGGRR
jgi:dihydroorotase